METYTVTVDTGTKYDGKFEGLSLTKAIKKLTGNTYGNDDIYNALDVIEERKSNKFGATFFCSIRNGAAVSIKLEC